MPRKALFRSLRRDMYRHVAPSASERPFGEGIEYLRALLPFFLGALVVLAIAGWVAWWVWGR
ncbi:MAG: hypothetical protein IPJ19_14115 [Planctomycetes bacterium]|nr:hypothetical protein [Planctomycetota bacterium]